MTSTSSPSLRDKVLEAARQGVSVRVSLVERTVHLDGQLLLSGGCWAGDLGLPRCRPEEALAHLEQEYLHYRQALPPHSKHYRGSRWFYAPPGEEPDRASVRWGEDRRLAGVRLELTALIYLMNGSLLRSAAPFAGKWYWRSTRHPDLVLLASWMDEEKV